MKLLRLGANDIRPEFSCGDDDLDEYFHVDSIKGCVELMSVTYILCTDADETLAYVSLSNDVVRKEHLSNSALKKIANGKRFKTIPAVKIGRLGVSKHVQGKSHGRQLIDFIKTWFKYGNKTGCRYLLVDAYNQEKPVRFYMKNEFNFLAKNDEDANDATRLMYFDLKRFTPRAS